MWVICCATASWCSTRAMRVPCDGGAPPTVDSMLKAPPTPTPMLAETGSAEPARSPGPDERRSQRASAAEPHHSQMGNQTERCPIAARRTPRAAPEARPHGRADGVAEEASGDDVGRPVAIARDHPD